MVQAMVPMCELQADLIAAVVAMFHRFLTAKNHSVLLALKQG